jgi:TetR/AcrR family transcriptional regulator, mexCD-oprJ operon repressor
MGTARAQARRGEVSTRRADAERNIATILAAGLDLFARNAEVSMADVARAAGLGRVTVYAHFPSRADLVRGLVARAIAETEQALDRAPAADGEPADETLARLLSNAWHVLDRYRSLRAHAVADLGPRALDRQHDPIRQRLEAIVTLGREQGRLRSDLPVAWMVATIFSLIHTAADEVNAGRLSRRAAPELVTATVLSALRPEAPQPAKARPRRRTAASGSSP